MPDISAVRAIISLPVPGTEVSIIFTVCVIVIWLWSKGSTAPSPIVRSVFAITASTHVTAISSIFSAAAGITSTLCLLAFAGNNGQKFFWSKDFCCPGKSKLAIFHFPSSPHWRWRTDLGLQTAAMNGCLVVCFEDMLLQRVPIWWERLVICHTQAEQIVASIVHLFRMLGLAIQGTDKLFKHHKHFPLKCPFFPHVCKSILEFCIWLPKSVLG